MSESGQSDRTTNEAADRLRGSLAILKGRAERGWQDDPKWDVNEIVGVQKDLDAALATERQEARRSERARIRAGLDRYGPAELIDPDGSGAVAAYYAGDVDPLLLDELEGEKR